MATFAVRFTDLTGNLACLAHEVVNQRGLARTRSSAQVQSDVNQL